MCAEETTEEKKPETPTEPEDAGDIPSTTSLINKADRAAERLEKALRMERENLDKREALMVRDALGGRSEAGQTQNKQFTPEEKESRARIKAVAAASGSSWGKNYE